MDQSEDQVDVSGKHVAEVSFEQFVKAYVERFPEGFRRGFAEGAALSVLTVLQARGIFVSNPIRESILAEENLDELQGWLKKAAVATSVNAILNEPQIEALATTFRKYQSDFARKYVAQGRAEMFAEAQTNVAARGLLTVLRSRGIEVPEAVRERILAQKNPEQLERWLEKAAHATSLAGVLDEPN